ncbi:MAG: tetratricopeptide repeat protein [Chryseolinea sp.]
MAKKEEHKHELLENPEALKEKLVGAETWLESNPKIVVGLAIALLLIAGGYFGFQYYKNSQNDEAQKEMFQAVFYFEADSLNKALNGDGNNLGFLAIIDDYKISDAGNLANYYAGVCYLKQGKFELARLYLEDFSADDLLVQARAYSLIGDSYMEEKNYDDAAKFYNKAANYKPNKHFSASYLLKEALAYELLKQNDKAREAYDKIITQYWDSAEFQNARKFKARLESKS